MRKEPRDNAAWLTAFGQSIAERRAYIAMTRQRLADISGVHRTYISDIERGSRNVTISTAYRIAEALELPASRLFSLADRKALEQQQQAKAT